MAAIADGYGAQLRLTRLRPSGRGVDTWDALHPTAAQQRMLYHWLLERPGVLTGDSFFHLSALGEPLDGLEPVRGGTRGLPDRPGRRRLRLPLRHRPPVPGRQRPRRRRLPRRLARVGSLHVAARAAERRRLRLLRLVRRLPRRLHGGQVLHRAAARRARSRVRATGTARPRLAALRRRGRGPSVGHSKVDAGRHADPGADAGALPLAGPQPDRRGARGRHLAGRWRRRRARSCWPCRSARSSSTGRTCRSTPTPASPWPWRDGLAARRPDVTVAPAVAYGASGEHAAFPGTLLVDHDVLADLLVELVRVGTGHVPRRRPGQRPWRQRGRRWPRSSSAVRAEGDDVLVWRAAVAGRRRARRPDRDVAACWPSTPRPSAWSWPSPAAPNRSTALLPRLRAEGVRPVSSNGVLGDPTGASAEEGRALLDALVRDLAAVRDATLVRLVSPVAVVTGAARGIGAATVDALVAGGWQVVAVDRLCRRPGARLPARHEGRPRGGGRPARRGRAHDGRRRPQPRRTCVPPWTRRSQHFGGLAGGRRRRPA